MRCRCGHQNQQSIDLLRHQDPIGNLVRLRVLVKHVDIAFQCLIPARFALVRRKAVDGKFTRCDTVGVNGRALFSGGQRDVVFIQRIVPGNAARLSNFSINVSTVPSAAVREMRCAPCSAVTIRPDLSSVFPLALLLGSRKDLTPPSASQRFNSFAGMSLKTRNPPGIQTGPSTKLHVRGQTLHLRLWREQLLELRLVLDLKIGRW